MNNPSKDNEYIQFEEFVKRVLGPLGKDEAELFLGKYREQWEDRIDRDEPELESFITDAIEQDSPACAIMLLNKWVKSMDKAEKYEAWQKKTSKQKKEDLEDEYFQIKTALFYIAMDKYGGRAGIVGKLSLARAESKNKNYEKASEQAKALLKLLDHNIFISQGPFQYVSISSKMESCIYIRLRVPFISVSRTKAVEPMSNNDYSSLTICLQSLSFYGTLTLYFFCRKMNKDALCCNYLKMQYATSDEQRKIIAQDFQHFSKSESRTFLQAKRLCNAYIKSLEKTDKHNNKSEDKSDNMINVSIEDIHESSQKYGYPMEVNPEIIKLVQSCREEAIIANDDQGVEYFDSILADWKKQKETAKNNILATKTQKDQKIVS